MSTDDTHDDTTAGPDVPGATAGVELRRSGRLFPGVPYAYAASAAPSAALLFTAGACPLDAEGRVVAPGDVVAQAEQVVSNLRAVLQEAGADLGSVVRSTVYVASDRREDLTAAWGVVRGAFGEHDAPSTLLGVSVLGWPDQLVEVEAVAVLPAPGGPQPQGPGEEGQVRHVGVAVGAPASDVYAYAADPRHLPRWAAGLAGGEAEQVEGGWAVDSPMGRVLVSFAERNPHGVLDHVVVLPSGERVLNPLRVVPGGAGDDGGGTCDVVFTVRRRPGMTADDFDGDCRAVLADLERLRDLVEGR